VLTELELAEFRAPSDGGPATRLSEPGGPVSLEDSALYRACHAQLAAIEQAFARTSELPLAQPAA
jgi:hypothetical protein